MNIYRKSPRSDRRLRLGVEPLEARCACSVSGLLAPAVLVPPTPPDEWQSSTRVPPPPAVVAELAKAAREQYVVQGPSLILKVNEHFHGIVAHFDGMSPEQVRAAIDWGNGVRTDGRIEPDGDDDLGFNVVGLGRYDAAGMFRMTVSVTPVDGSKIDVNGYATVLPNGDGPDRTESFYNPAEEVPEAPEGIVLAPQPDAELPVMPTSGDTSGAVPWMRLVDLGTSAGAKVLPPVPAVPELPPVVAVDPDAPETVQSAPPPGPDYLVTAAEEMAEILPPPRPAFVAAELTVDPRMLGGGSVEPVGVMSPAGAPLRVEPAAPRPRPEIEGALTIVPAEEPKPPTKAKAGRRPSLWRSGAAWCAALIFTERTLAAWRGDRTRSPRKRTRRPECARIDKAS